MVYCELSAPCIFCPCEFALSVILWIDLTSSEQKPECFCALFDCIHCLYHFVLPTICSSSASHLFYFAIHNYQVQSWTSRHAWRWHTRQQDKTCGPYTQSCSTWKCGTENLPGKLWPCVLGFKGQWWHRKCVGLLGTLFIPIAKNSHCNFVSL